MTDKAVALLNSKPVYRGRDGSAEDFPSQNLKVIRPSPTARDQPDKSLQRSITSQETRGRNADPEPKVERRDAMKTQLSSLLSSRSSETYQSNERRVATKQVQDRLETKPMEERPNTKPIMVQEVTIQ